MAFYGLESYRLARDWGELSEVVLMILTLIEAFYFFSDIIIKNVNNTHI